MSRRTNPSCSGRCAHHGRKGVILVLSALVIVVMLIMAAFAIDIGFIVLTKAQLQNAADAATLAAVLEMGNKVETPDWDDIKKQATAQAIKVARMNRAAGRPVDVPEVDVIFGRRLNGSIVWSPPNPPYNSVKVITRRDDENPDSNRGKLRLHVARIIGHDFAKVTATSRAFVNIRDLVFVIDKSGSMRSDTERRPTYFGNNAGMYGGGEGLQKIYDDLFGDGSSGSGGPAPGLVMQHPAAAGTPHNEKKDTASKLAASFPGYKNLYDWTLNNDLFDNSKTGSQLSEAEFFDQEFPAADLPSGLPDEHWRHWKWQAYANAVFERPSANVATHDGGRSHDLEGYIGYESYVTFLIHQGLLPAYKSQRIEPYHPGNNPRRLYPLAKVGDQWKTDGEPLVRIYPLHNVRVATMKGIQAIEELSTPGSIALDKVGYVSYGTIANVEMDLTDDLDRAENAAANLALGAHGRANGWTNIQMGIKMARKVLTEGTAQRPHATKVMVVLSDGIPTVFDDAGEVRNGSKGRTNAVNQAQLAADSGIKIHTIAMGRGADRDLMEKIAELGKGQAYIIGADGNINEDELVDVFVAIARDRLGKLFRE